MKKIFSILFTSVIAFMAVSCYTEDLAVFDVSKAKAPVLGSYEVGAKAVTASFTPGSFNQNFNNNVSPNHFFVITKVDDKAVSKTVTTTNKDGVLSASITSINNTLISMGYKEGDIVSLIMKIRASMQTNAGDNGRNGYVDSDGTIEIGSFEIVFPKGSPYMEYTETSPFGVTGSISNYEISWDKDLEMWMTEDGLRHVAKYVKLSAGDEFKFRKDQSWGENYGGEFGSLDAAFSVSQDGPNIKAPADGYYDLWLDLGAGTAMLSEAYVAYPGCVETSNWGVTGSLSEYSISWDKDLPMLTDGNVHVAQGVKLASTDEFKFRQDGGWAVNMGGEFGGLGSDFAVTQDGPNIKVGGDGIFDLVLNPGAGTAQIVETLGGGVSGIIGGDEPGPEPPAVTGWNIIGLNGDWENDIIARQEGSKWIAFISCPEATEFKWRKDGAWDEDFGGVFEAFDEPFEAVPGGPNIQVEDGFWMVVLDTEALTITISLGDVWSLIGDFNGWAADVDMILTDGKWVSPVTKLNANGFKIRHNHNWALDMGGAFEAFGQPFAAVAGGENIMLPADGEYIVVYDPAEKTITVNKSISGWNVIGLNGDWDNDVLATENDGVWTVRVNVPEATDFKWRKDGGWTENYGGDFVALGEPFPAVADGNNIKLEAGFWLLTLDLSGAAPMLMVSDGEVWSLIGDFNGWGGDVDMELTDGKWVSPPTMLNTNGFKIRHNHDWTLSVGGTFEALNTPFEAISDNGPNIMLPEDGEYIVIYDPEAATITVKPGKKAWSIIGDFTGWSSDIDMVEVAPDIWVSPSVTIESGGWKLRYDHDWAVNRGGATPETIGEFVGAVPDGDNIGMTGTFQIVYNASNETIGTLGWGVVGSIASIPGFNWNNDIPMNFVESGWVSSPVYLTTDDQIKIRWMGGWDENRGGKMETVDYPFDAVPNGDNIIVPADGWYIVVYDPEEEVLALTNQFWSLIGDFNGWAGDVFLMFNGNNEWVAYNQTLPGGWKVRMGCSWDENRGGDFVEAGTPFDVVQNGPNIDVGDLTGFKVIFNQETNQITVVK